MLDQMALTNISLSVKRASGITQIIQIVILGGGKMVEVIHRYTHQRLIPIMESI